MHETKSVLDLLGLNVPLDWTVDAFHLLDNPEGGWKIVMLAWDNAQQRFLLCDINEDVHGDVGNPTNVSDPYVSGDLARKAYVDRIAARLFRLNNSKAPALTYELENEEDRT